jgi:hypothetical protein
MEYNYEDRSSDNDIAAYERCIQDIYFDSQDSTRFLNEIKEFGARFRNESPEGLETLGHLMMAAIRLLPESVDAQDRGVAQQMFIRGAITGLYLGDRVSAGEVSHLDVLAAARRLIQDDVYAFVEETTTFVSHTKPITKDILNHWKSMGGGDMRFSELFDTGLGVMNASMRSALNDKALFNELELSMDWDGLDLGGEDMFRLEPVDDICQYLAERVDAYATQLSLTKLNDQDQVNGLAEIEKLLIDDFSKMTALEVDDQVQTRGFGLYVGVDDEGDEVVYEIQNGTSLRAKIIGVECMMLPTLDAILSGQTQHVDSYVPLGCLMLDNVQIVDESGCATPKDGVVGLTLGVDGARLSKIVYQDKE